MWEISGNFFRLISTSIKLPNSSVGPVPSPTGCPLKLHLLQHLLQNAFERNPVEIRDVGIPQRPIINSVILRIGVLFCDIGNGGPIATTSLVTCLRIVDDVYPSIRVAMGDFGY
ncbi:hypothetical protein Y032_0029g2012 [Ancylostoma ceylanicum]|uniref:Uncharacterized protein n=1 Tax=Ancylostoma ceylanicum TaxID=53326 RepID=A0A016USW7_9BILA|nr:hypothetical protein Y032_0029g2012 [Ancylostoma ceylanicum]